MAGFPSAVLNWLGLARYNASAPSIVAGNTSEMQCDAAGRLRTTTQGEAPTGRVSSVALENNHVIVTGGGKLLELYGFNDDSTQKYLMFFDAIALPSNGATNFIARFRVPSGGTVAFSPGYPIAFTAGLVWGASTTPGSLTVDTVSKTALTVVYQ